MRLVSVKITKDIMKQTKLKYEGCGLEISATASNTLAVGDRILEVNGEGVVDIDRNNWHKMRKRLTQPYQAVVMRVDTKHGRGSEVLSDDTALEDNIALIRTRLEMKLKEGGNVKNELKSVTEERDKLRMANTRLHHRVAYLEDRFGEMEINKV